MKRLLDEPSLGSAFRFGWNALAGMLSEHFWIYAAIAIGGALMATFISTPSNYRHESIEWIATFPALAAAVRFARPDFRMDWRIVVGIVGLWALIVGIGAAVFVPLWLLMRSFPIAGAFLALLLPFAIWIFGKLTLALPYYVLADETERGIRDAIVESIDTVSGGFWWTVIGVAICIGLVCTTVPTVVADTIMKGWGDASLAAKIFATLIYYAGAIPEVVWIQASLVALATSARPQYLAIGEVA